MLFGCDFIAARSILLDLGEHGGNYLISRFFKVFPSDIVFHRLPPYLSRAHRLLPSLVAVERERSTRKSETKELHYPDKIGILHATDIQARDFRIDDEENRNKRKRKRRALSRRK